MGRVVVNGCFLARGGPIARNARAMTLALADRLPDRVHLALPDVGIVPAELGISANVAPNWHGARGLSWEQTDLTRMLDHTDILVSPTGTGPPRRRQVLVIPEPEPDDLFASDPDLRRFIEVTQVGTARRAAAVVTTSATRAQRLRDELGLRNVHVIPAGIDAPFTTSHRDETTAAGFRPYALGVGAHERASRLDWLAIRWNLLRQETPLNLVLTTSSVRTGPAPRLPAGVHVVVDPSERQLAQLYANAEMLLFPGGIESPEQIDLTEDPTGPLVRALASGTPFLASDSAAARSVAVLPEAQLIDLTRFGQATPAQADEAWVTRMHQWATVGPPVSREACRTKAAQFSWSAAAGRVANLIQMVD